MWRQVKELIQNKKEILLVTHQNPDGDGIGSCSALIELLNLLGKQGCLLTEEPIPAKFNFLNFRDAFYSLDGKIPERTPEAIFILDTHEEKRLGKVYQWIEAFPKVPIICIDHHCFTDSIADIQIIDEKACCCGSMVYTFFKELGIPLTLNAAKGIYTSVMCDTGRFSHSSTCRKTHKIADECIKIGVDPHYIYSEVYQQVSLKHIQYFMHSLERMEMYYSNRVVIQEISSEDCKKLGDDFDDLEFMHEFHKRIDVVEFVILLKEIELNKIRVSMRTKSNVDLTLIMHLFGGGGHPKAAGATINGGLEEVKQKLLKELENVFDEKRAVKSVNLQKSVVL
jgi:bifunctional oligoribonuclease and PAP phosphatase NrnA